MSRPTLTLHTRPGWRPLPPLLVMAAAGALAGGVWWTVAPEPAERPAVVVQETASWGAAASPFGPATMPPPAAPAPLPIAITAAVVPAPSRPALEPAPPAPVSIMVAPGVHLTPISVPPGAMPVPAGPQPHDSEPEN